MELATPSLLYGPRSTPLPTPASRRSPAPRSSRPLPAPALPSRRSSRPRRTRTRSPAPLRPLSRRSSLPRRPRSPAAPALPRSLPPEETRSKNSTTPPSARTLRVAIAAVRPRGRDREPRDLHPKPSPRGPGRLRTTLCISRGQPSGYPCGFFVHCTGLGLSTAGYPDDPQLSPRRRGVKSGRDPAISEALPIIHSPYFEAVISDPFDLSFPSKLAKVRLTRAACQRKGRRASGLYPAR